MAYINLIELITTATDCFLTEYYNEKTDINNNPSQ